MGLPKNHANVIASAAIVARSAATKQALDGYGNVKWIASSCFALLAKTGALRRSRNH